MTAITRHLVSVWNPSVGRRCDAMLRGNSASLLDIPLDGFEIEPESPGAIGNRQRRQIKYTKSKSIHGSDELRRQVEQIHGRGTMHFVCAGERRSS